MHLPVAMSPWCKCSLYIVNKIGRLSSDVNHPLHTPLSEFYKGKSVLITGGTGFLGKVFIEKLLNGCQNIDKVYLLVRAQNHENAKRRIEEITEKALFTKLKQKRPQDLKKIVPIIGDISKTRLGIGAEDEQKLIDDVSVVFHSAATLSFNEPLNVALNINYEGTRRLLELCKKMKSLDAFVYISTAYTNTNKKVIEEVVYPPPANVHDVYKSLEKCSGTKMENNELIGDQPNTYTFTKALAENLVAKNHPTIPSVIVRPSLVFCSKRDLPGWVDAWSLPTALLFSTAKGFNRVVYGKRDNVVDIIPVDYVVNMCIAAAARCDRHQEFAVYNCCSSVCNPVTLETWLKTFSAEFVKHGVNDLPYPYPVITTSKPLAAIFTFITQTITSYAVDIWYKIKGKKPRLVKTNKKFLHIRNMTEYFTANSWYITSSRARALAMSLAAEDRARFPCDPADIDWPEYIKTHVYGVNKYLIGDSKKRDGK